MVTIEKSLQPAGLSESQMTDLVAERMKQTIRRNATTRSPSCQIPCRPVARSIDLAGSPRGCATSAGETSRNPTLTRVCAADLGEEPAEVLS